jgi:hypothetical protein
MDYHFSTTYEYGFLFLDSYVIIFSIMIFSFKKYKRTYGCTQQWTYKHEKTKVEMLLFRSKIKNMDQRILNNAYL